MDLPHLSSRRAVLAGALTTGVTTGVVASGLPAVAADDIPSSPGSQFFLKLGTILGDSTNAAHPRTIDLLTWSFGADTTISPFNPGSGTTKSKPRDFTFIARMGSHSPHLFAAAAKGTLIGPSTLWARRASTAFEYLVVTMENLYVTSYVTAPSDTDAYPLDVVRVDFGKLTQTFRFQKPDGSAGTPITQTFNFVTNV